MLSFVWRAQGMQFAGVTQLLPMGASSSQATAALASMEQALKGSFPTAAHENLKLQRDVMAWKEYRSSTKHLVCAIANSLKMSLPDGFTLKWCQPENILAPASSGGQRHMYLAEELALAGKPSDFQAAFVCSTNGLRFPDYYISESFFKLVVSCDEGTEVPSITNKSIAIFMLGLVS